jgi:hypothetical protein
MPEAITVPISVKLHERVPGQLPIEKILKDNAWRRYFSALAEHYLSLLRHTAADVRQIAEFSIVTYLIDADVVRNLVESRPGHSKQTRDAVEFFETEHIQYAMPIGAFQEIVEWLQSFMPSAISWASLVSEPQHHLTAPMTLREMALAFGISLDGRGDDALADRLIAAVGTNRIVLERVLAVFTNKGFAGVVTDYDLEDVMQLHSIIGQMPRVYDDNRDTRLRRDYRDAVNLAIVCKAIRAKNHDAHTRNAGYVLVTQTRVLLDLVRQAQEDGDEDTILALSSLLGMRAPVLENLYPVMSPGRVYIVEDARARQGLNESTITSLDGEERVYEELLRVLSRRGDTRYGYASLRQDAAAVRTCLEHLAGTYQTEEFYRKLERRRAIEASLQYIESKQSTSTVLRPASEPEFEIQLNSFFRILQQVQLTVDQITPVSYSLTTIDEEDFGPNHVQDYVIRSTSPGEDVLRGEVFSATPAQEYQAYTTRWLTSCTEKRFFSALSTTLLSKSSITKFSDAAFRRISDPQEVWPEGILLFTTDGVFGRQCDVGRAIKGATLEQLLAAVRATDPVTRPDIRIDALRICTEFGDFQLDLGIQSIQREVFVVTHVDIAPQIVHLCQMTSLLTIFPVRLNEVLKQITSHFPQFQEAKTSR